MTGDPAFPSAFQKAPVSRAGAVLAGWLCLGACAAPRDRVASAPARVPAASAPPVTERGYSPIDTRGFADGIEHYRNKSDRRAYARYREDQILVIAANLMLYQRRNGGWPANFDPLRVLTATERAAVAAEQIQEDTTFDNRATYPNVDYLAAVYVQTRDARHRTAAERGLSFILSAQYQSGGYPHSFPSQRDYRPLITFMDDVMPGILATLGRAARAEGPFEFLGAAEREKVQAAWTKGNDCILRLQIRVGGELTAWAGQYDPQTLTPVAARSYELPALVSAESVAVVRYLMRLSDPSTEVKQAIEAAVRWFERSKILGIRVEEFPAPLERYEHHTSTTDRRVVEDASAAPIWARFYEIETNRPFMANRDGKKVYSLAEVQRERRTGYSWYNDEPAQLLARDYPEWRRQHATP